MDTPSIINLSTHQTEKLTQDEYIHLVSQLDLLKLKRETMIDLSGITNNNNGNLYHKKATHITDIPSPYGTQNQNIVYNTVTNPHYMIDGSHIKTSEFFSKHNSIYNGTASNNYIHSGEAAKRIMYKALFGSFEKNHDDDLIYYMHDKTTNSNIYHDTTTDSYKSIEEQNYMSMLYNIGPFGVLKDAYTLLRNPILTNEFVINYKIKLDQLLREGIPISDIKKSGIANNFYELKLNLGFKLGDLKINKTIFNISHLINFYGLSFQRLETDYKIVPKTILVDLMFNVMELHTIDKSFDYFLEQKWIENKMGLRSFLYRMFLTNNTKLYTISNMQENIKSIKYFLNYEQDNFFEWQKFCGMSIEKMEALITNKHDITKIMSCQHTTGEIINLNDMKRTEIEKYESFRSYITERNKINGDEDVKKKPEYQPFIFEKSKEGKHVFSDLPNIFMIIIVSCKNDTDFDMVDKEMKDLEISTCKKYLRYTQSVAKESDKRHIKQYKHQKKEFYLIPYTKTIPTIEQVYDPNCLKPELVFLKKGPGEYDKTKNQSCTQQPMHETFYNATKKNLLTKVNNRGFDLFNMQWEKMKVDKKGHIKRGQVYFIDPSAANEDIIRRDNVTYKCVGLIMCNLYITIFSDNKLERSHTKSKKGSKKNKS